MSFLQGTVINKHEKLLITAFIVAKILLLIQLPLFGDEAYFLSWGKDLSLGYYDHPPMVGWTIHLLNIISENHYFHRFFAFLTSIVISLFIYLITRNATNKESAFLTALIFFVSPASLITVLLTNDVVLVLFGVTGFYVFSQALLKNSLLLAVAAGVFFGLTFLSKYFSVLMFIGIAIYLIKYRSTINYKVVLVTTLVFLLFALENLYFNINNCWNNILFNLVARTRDSDSNTLNPLYYLLSLLFFIPPYAIYHLKVIRKKSIPNTLIHALYIATAFLACLLAVSFFKKIGLHWLLLCLPFIYLLFSLFQTKQQKHLLKYNAYLSIIIAIPLISAFSFQSTLFKNNKDLMFYSDTQTICDLLPANETIFTLGYSANSVLSYACKNNRFHVIGNTSKYGREDDKHIDFSDLDGKNIWIFATNKDASDGVATYFSNTETSRLAVSDEVDFYLVRTEGFNFKKYKSKILSVINQRFYTRPFWLPEAQCNFKTKYGLRRL
ncbi:MAG: glycosyltransferase family 39 protein [Gammaproteobacteria bacterium]|nr:glycosyltransferase family 39 protein [Gammaproteobacteria bacterium]